LVEGRENKETSIARRKAAATQKRTNDSGRKSP
jgi:hypothetical protein